MKWIMLALWIGFWLWVSQLDKSHGPKRGADSWN
jgi:hypothetical protein